MPSFNPLLAGATALCAAFAAIAPAALAPGSARAEPPANVVRYRCSGSSGVRSMWALFFNSNPAEVVLLPEGSHAGDRLLQLPSGSGARYGDGNQEFWIKGDTARWQHGGTAQCRVVQER